MKKEFFIKKGDLYEITFKGIWFSRDNNPNIPIYYSARGDVVIYIRSDQLLSGSFWLTISGLLFCPEITEINIDQYFRKLS